MNANLSEKLSDIRSRLSDLVRRILDEVSTTGYSEDEKNYFASLHNLVLDDITYVDSIAEAIKAGYLHDAQDTLAAIDVTVNSDPHDKYVPVMFQLRLEGIEQPVFYLLYAARNVSRADNFAQAMKTAALRLDRHFNARITMSSGVAQITARVTVLSTDGVTYGIKDYTELLAYLTLASSGFLCLGKLRSIDTADDLVTSYDHNSDFLTQDYNKSVRVYNECFAEVDPSNPANRIRDALHSISVLRERVDINQDMILVLRSQLATQKIDSDEALSTAKADLQRRSDDNIIVGMVAVILLFFIILSFLH